MIVVLIRSVNLADYLVVKFIRLVVLLNYEGSKNVTIFLVNDDNDDQHTEEDNNDLIFVMIIITCYYCYL